MIFSLQASDQFHGVKLKYVLKICNTNFRLLVNQLKNELMQDMVDSHVWCTRMGKTALDSALQVLCHDSLLREICQLVP